MVIVLDHQFVHSITINEISENGHLKIENEETNYHKISSNSIIKEDDANDFKKQESVKFNLRPIIGKSISNLKKMEKSVYLWYKIGIN